MTGKALIVSFLMASFFFVCTVNNGYSASAGGGFEQRKAQQLRRIDTRISQMQEQRRCVSAATNEDDLKACRERSRPAKNPRQS
jgi:hypothetical protein